MENGTLRSTVTAGTPGRYPRLLVVSSCTGAKRFQPAGALTLDDFQAGGAHLARRERELRSCRTSARRMYTGAQHAQVVAGFEMIERSPSRAGLVFDLKIVSAGYGLIDQYDHIVPYETTFAGMRARDVQRWASQLRIPENLNAAIRDYQLVVFLLGNDYLEALRLPLEGREDQSFVFLTSSTGARRVPRHAARQAVLPLVNADARRFGWGLVGLKGYLFRQLAAEIARRPECLREWHADPARAVQYLQDRSARCGPRA